MKKMSTLHVKSCRSGKCETNSTLNVKIWSVWLVFSAFFWFWGVNISGSVMIFRESVKF